MMRTEAASHGSNNNQAAALKKGELAIGMGRADEAARAARRVLRRDRLHVGALELLARALWQQGHYAELLEVIRKLVRVNPYEPGYYALQGAAYQALGRYGEAVRAYGRSLEAEPDGGNSLVRESLSELQTWQSELIADLIAKDPVFRAKYAQDPMRACQARGFAFVRASVQEGWLIESRAGAGLLPRPS